VDHVEPLVDQAIATLKAGLPARIAAANAEASDFDIPAIADQDYWAGGQTSLVRYPAIEVSAFAGELFNLSVSQAEADTDVQLAVIGWVAMTPETGGDFSNLYRAATRYGRAILETLLVPDAFGAGVVVERASYRYAANPTPGERQLEEIVCAAMLFFTLGDVEARP
jgi:hypothetical protein